MGKVTKVVIDSNVFISAFGWGGKPLKIIELLEQGKIKNCTSEKILHELSLSLSYPKLAFPQSLKSDILEFVIAYSDIYEPEEHLSITPDPDDNKLIECALTAGAKYVITGDKRLLSIKQFGGIKILAPTSFLSKKH